MVISIISDAKNVFIPMSLFFIILNGLRNNNVVARQAVEILAVGIVGGVDVVFIVFRDEIDFHVFVVIFNQNLEISDECDFLSFHFENSIFKVTMKNVATKIALAIVYTES